MSRIGITEGTFRYGLGVFETVIVRGGIPHFVEWHWGNLCIAAKAISIPEPDADVLKKTFSGDGVWRWFATTAGTLDFFEEGIPPAPEAYRVSFSELRVSSKAWESRYKTTSYLLRYQAKVQSRLEEELLLNENGFLAGACMANVFFLKEGVLHTPAVDAGCRGGVVRRWVMEYPGITVREGLWAKEEILSSDEIFLTNSRIGVRPVVEIEGVKKNIGDLSRKLLKDFLNAGR